MNALGDFAQVQGPTGLDFVLTADLLPGARAMAKIRVYSLDADDMVTLDFPIRVWDVLGGMMGVAGTNGWGTILRGPLTVTDYILVAVRQLDCP